MRLFWTTLLILVVVLARSDSSVHAASVGVPLLRWTGQDFAQKQGGAFTTFSLNRLGGVQGVDVEVILYSILDRAYYTMTFRSVEGTPPNERLIWVFRAGKYAIRAVRMEAGGKRFRWNTSKNGTSFLVQRGVLSNLGEWVLEPEEGGRLQVKIRKVPTPFPSDHPPFQGRVAAVIDGFGGQVQTRVGAREPLARRSPSPGDEESPSFANIHIPPPPTSLSGDSSGTDSGARLRVSESRDGRHLSVAMRQSYDVSLFYQLDLVNDNELSGSLIRVFRASDTRFRACFTNRMVQNGFMRGSVKFSLVISHRSRSITALRHVGGSFSDQAAIQCVATEMERLSLPVGKTVVGQLVWTFSVK